MASFCARTMPRELLLEETGWSVRSVLRLNDLCSERAKQEDTPRKRANVEHAVLDRSILREGFETDTPWYQESPRSNTSGFTESPRSNMLSLSSESEFDENDIGVCVSCAKTHYRRPDDRMIICSNRACNRMGHQKCHSPPLTFVPKGPYYCSMTCEEIVRNNPHLLYDSSQGTHSENDDTDESESDNDDMDEADLMQGCLPKQSCLMIAAEKALLHKSQNPISFVSMEQYATSHCSITPAAYQGLLQGMINHLQSKNVPLRSGQVSILERESPPMNVRRSLRALGSCDMRTVELTYKIPSTKIVAFFKFHYRCPLSVALDLHESYTIRVGSPVFRWDSEFCCSCSGRYPDLKGHIERMARELDIDLESSVFFPVLCYCDESSTSSRNVQFNSMWMHPAGIDVDARNVLREDCHGFLALLPVESHLQFRSEDGQDSEAECHVSKQNRTKACRQLRLQALRTIFKDWKRSEEEGYRCEIDGEIVYFRPVLFGMVTDMAERREHLCLRRNAYHCSACYNFPGKNIKEADRIKKKSGLRSNKVDQEIRSEFEKGATSQTREDKEEEFKGDEKLRTYGIELIDSCPLSAYEDSRIYIPNHASHIYRFDALHCKHGVIKYFCMFADKAVNSRLIPESRRFGNVYLETGKYNMHVMEGDIESFHVMPLTLAFGNFGVDIEPEVRLNLYLGACDLLRILGLLTDPCPKMIREKLKTAIESFQKRLRKLLEEEWNGSKEETTKMHELFSHVVDALEVAGHADGFSTKVQETVHRDVKALFLSKSSRRTDSVFREMLWTSFHRMTVKNALALDKWKECMVERDEPFYPATSFRILRSKVAQGPLASQILQNFRSVANRVLGRNVSIPSSVLLTIQCPEEGSVYGNAMLGFVECTKRQVHISRSQKFRVLNSNGKQRPGGMVFLLAYASDECNFTSVSSSTSCKDPRCRFQNPGFNLFCSSSRDESTLHGFPVLFVNESVILWPLERVSSARAILPRKHDAIVEYWCVPDRLIEIPFSRIRGASLFKCPNQKLFGKPDIGFVFSGRNVFGY